MVTTRKLLAGLALGIGLVTQATATDYTAMREDPRVRSELFAVSVAWIIDEQCSSFKPRKAWAVLRALDLAAHARTLGYSNAEIEAYINDDDEQARYLEMAKPYLARQGAVAGDEESYCAVGRAEKERGSLIGKLLKGG